MQVQKIVLSKGYEFDLVTDGVRETADGNTAIITFVPGEYTVEQLLEIWKGNSTISVKLGDTSIHVINNMTNCSSVSLVPDYLIRTIHVCPECGVEVEATAINCYNCNAAFENGPAIQQIRGTVCVAKIQVPNINDRMNDAEESIEDIINTILG